MDLFLGDWDRHHDQWKWIRTGGDETPWTPVPRDRVEPRPGNPPLLKHGPQGPRDGNLAPRDGDLPLLEQQRQRNQQKPKVRSYD